MQPVGKLADRVPGIVPAACVCKLFAAQLGNAAGNSDGAVGFYGENANEFLSKI